MVDVPAPQIGEDVDEHGLLLRQLVADGQRAKTRRLGRCRIQQIQMFHGMMSKGSPAPSAGRRETG
jgi:hypothetical protein